MKTINELKNELKSSLEDCTFINDGSLAAQVDENIQWAWDNWDFDHEDYLPVDPTAPIYFSDGPEQKVKPERYTASFRDQWIENEDFYVELERINS